MQKKLTAEELQEIQAWLGQNEVTYKNINRDFSDARPMVILLKKLYPKLVDLHNYPAHNNTQLKQNNWDTLNQKVLAKLGLHKSKKMLEKLAMGVPGAIESLLFDIMLVDRAEKSKNAQGDEEQQQLWAENGDVMTVTVNKKMGDALCQVPQKMILYSIYEEAQRESEEKDNIIADAEQKIAHLEDDIKLKVKHIHELCTQVAKVSMGSSCIGGIFSNTI